MFMRLGSRVTAIIALLIGSLVLCGPSTSQAQAKKGSLQYRGELNGDVFDEASRNDREVVIKSSRGGSGASALALTRVKAVVIDGECLSACAWAFVNSPTACFTNRASFGFHASSDPGTGRRMPAATAYWLDTVRPALRPVLTSLGSSASVIYVNARQMKQYYGDRACDASSQTN